MAGATADVRTPYFRLMLRHAPEQGRSAGAAVRQVRQEEVEEVAAFINRCYDGTSMTSEQVRAWLRHPVGDPTLWIWVDDSAGVTAGLGIGEFDREISEGSLEWVQVLPEHRRRGIGRQVVGELVRRLEGRAAFTTVSGRMDASEEPEKLYRSCGFEGKEARWMVRPTG